MGDPAILRYMTKEADGGQKYCFHCPACGFSHWVKTGGTKRPIWKFNGDMEKPTITPSILAWADDFKCHSFITDGVIRYLGDCTHDMAGKSIPLTSHHEDKGGAR